nr:general odorant-binding protein 45-like [Aedes albopictus]
MRGFSSLIVLAVVALAGSVLGRHDAAFKSFGSTGGECSQYLNNDGNGDCNVHCIGVVAHVWNDTLAKFTQNYAGYFVPDPKDDCYVNRTERCLMQVDKSVEVYDKCTRARQLGQCYADQYGELVPTQLQYVPMTDLQYTRVFLQCAAMLGLSNADLDAMVQQGAYNVPAGECLLRCTLIRMGLYTDEKGFDVPLATRQCGLYNATSDIDQCQANVMASQCDKCKRTVTIAKDCLNMHYNVRKVGESYALELYGGVCYSSCSYFFYCYYYGCPYLSYYNYQETGSSSYAVNSNYFEFAG